MVIPTPQDISEIIEKLKELQTAIENIESNALEFAKQRRSVPIEQIIKVAVGHGLSKDEKSKFDRWAKSPDDILAGVSRQKALQRAVELIPTLSQKRLEKLLNQSIPELWADKSIPKTEWRQLSISAAGSGGPAQRFTEAGRNLDNIRYLIEQQIERNIKTAKAERTQKHVKPLQDQIEKLLLPFWDYIKKKGSYGNHAKILLMPIIKEGRLGELPDVVKEFERIEYSLEVEATHQEPCEELGGNSAKAGDIKKSQGKDGQGTQGIPDYIALDLAKRTVTMGTKIHPITSEKVWDFLKNLCSAFKDDRLVPRYDGATNNKNNVDQFRRLIGKEALHEFIVFLNHGYKLNPEVEIIGGGQISIRKTHLSHKRE